MSMATVLSSSLTLAAAFLVGSLPTALVIGRLRGVDIRRHGSGNIGATNAFRVLGAPAGVACLLLDAAKGWAPAYLIIGDWLPAVIRRPEALERPLWGLLVGIAAIAGHSFSPWVGWRGGKGVAASLGVYLAVAPLPLVVCLLVGVGLIAWTNYVSVASLVGAVLLPTLIALWPPGGERSWGVIALTLLLGLFVIWRHRGNLRRLLAGTENRLFASRAGGGSSASSGGAAR